MSNKPAPEFFTGYAETPPELSRFLTIVIAVIFVSSFLLALVLGYGVQERGNGRFGGEVKVVGILENAPYPILRTSPSPAAPLGHTYLVAGGGKNGISLLVQKLQRRPVEVQGFALRRGTLDMIVVDSEAQAVPVEPAASVQLSERVALGRYRLAGEICDGKCYPGGMRPGTGLAHKACANLCIIGGQPAIFAIQSPLAGQNFLLLADKNGGLPPNTLFDYTALPVEMDGEVSRIGDLLVFHADWSTIRKQ